MWVVRVDIGVVACERSVVQILVFRVGGQYLDTRKCGMKQDTYDGGSEIESSKNPTLSQSLLRFKHSH